MKKTKTKEVANVDVCLIGSLFGTHKKTEVEKEFKIPEETKETVINNFKFNPTNETIRFHFDDGIYGGGSDIPYSNDFGLSSIHYPCTYSVSGYYDDPKYFNPDRKGIFHYCIFCDEECEGWSGKGSTVDKPILLIASKAINKTDTFMHELGHNLMGYLHDERKDGNKDGNPDGPANPPLVPYNGNNIDTAGHFEKTKDIKYNHCTNKCIMHSPKITSDTFCAECWEHMKLGLLL